MAVLSAIRSTLLDVARRQDPNGKVATVAEVMSQFNDILDDITFQEGNLETGHKVTVRSSLPTPTWRLLNQGVTQTKSTTKQIIETCGMCEAYSEIDKDLALLNGNTAQFRYTEDLAHIEAINQAFSTALVYGDTSVNPEQFVGLAPRYYQVSGGTAATAGNVIDAGGAGTTCASVWLVGWSESTVTGIYPKGSNAGLQVNDLGEQTVYDASSRPFQAFRTHYQWKVGLAVKDWRYVVRIANLNVGSLETASDTVDASANLIKFLSQAIDLLPTNGMVRPVFYMNRRCSAMLRVKLLSAGNTQLTLDELTGPFQRPTLKFMGVPVRRIDSLTSTEAAVTTTS
jgi:hypothetical protein